MEDDSDAGPNLAIPPEDLRRLASSGPSDSPPVPDPPVAFERFEAMMLCLAIGDSLGNPTESQLPAKRRAKHGELTGYIPHPKLGDARGYPSDDTQMAFWTLEHLLEHGRIVPQELSRTFATRRIFGIGSSVRAFSENHARGLDWSQCGVASAGNGALMRIAPLVYHSLLGRNHLLVPDTILATAVTHNDSMAIASSVAAVDLLVKCCRMDRIPDREWWATEYIAVLKEYEVSFSYRSRSPAYSSFEGSLWQFLDRHLLEPQRRTAPLLHALDWYSGAYLLETVPTSLLILMRHAGDPVQAMLRAVNDTKDNDTIAAIVGAFLGALHGKDFVPESWLSGLVGRTGEDDDGAVFRILARARLHGREDANGWEEFPNRRVVADGILTNQWDRISGTVQRIEGEGSRIVINLRKRRASVTVDVGGCAELLVDGSCAEPGAIQPGHHLAAIGTYEEGAFRACSVRLFSDVKSAMNARDPIQPPGIRFWLLDTGEVVIRQVGHPGEEILLRDQEELNALRANPGQLRRLFDLAQRGELPRRGW